MAAFIPLFQTVDSVLGQLVSFLQTIGVLGYVTAGFALIIIVLFVKLLSRL